MTEKNQVRNGHIKNTNIQVFVVYLAKVSPSLRTPLGSQIICHLLKKTGSVVFRYMAQKNNKLKAIRIWRHEADELG